MCGFVRMICVHGSARPRSNHPNKNETFPGHTPSRLVLIALSWILQGHKSAKFQQIVTEKASTPKPQILDSSFSVTIPLKCLWTTHGEITTWTISFSVPETRDRKIKLGIFSIECLFENQPWRTQLGYVTDSIKKKSLVEIYTLNCNKEGN